MNRRPVVLSARGRGWVGVTVVLLLAAVVLSGSPQRQVFKPPQGRVENVRFEQGAGGVINIYYDLQADDAMAVFAVTLEVSKDAGKTYSIKPSSLSGDVGPNVKGGVGKKIVWEAGKDVESVAVGEFAFQVVAVAGRATRSKEDASPAGSQPPKPDQAASAASHRGSPMKWVLPLAGGAAVVGGVVAAKGKGTPKCTGGCGTPNCPPCIVEPPPPTARIQYSESPAPFVQNAVAFNGTASSSPNGAIANWAWQFGDGATGSGGTVNHTYANGTNAGQSYTVQLTVTDAAGKSNTTSVSVAVGSLLGTWVNTTSGVTRTLKFNGTGASISGTYQNTMLDNNGEHPLVAYVSSNRTVRLETQGLSSNFVMPSAVIDATGRSFSGVVSGSSVDGQTLTFTRQ